MGALLAEAHQDHIRGETVQPGRKGGFATESVNFAEELEESFLREVFGFEGVADHTEAEAVDTARVLAVELFEGSGVAALGAEDCGIEWCGDGLERARRCR